MKNSEKKLRNILAKHWISAYVPKEGQEVVFFDESENRSRVGFYKNKAFHAFDKYWIYSVSHWIPLPSSPELIGPSDDLEEAYEAINGV